MVKIKQELLDDMYQAYFHVLFHRFTANFNVHVAINRCSFLKYDPWLDDDVSKTSLDGFLRYFDGLIKFCCHTMRLDEPAVNLRPSRMVLSEFEL